MKTIIAICGWYLFSASASFAMEETFSGLSYTNPVTSLHAARGADITLDQGVTDIQFNASAGTLAFEYHIPGSTYQSFDLWLSTPQGTGFSTGSYLNADLNIFQQPGRSGMLFAYEGMAPGNGGGEFNIREMTWSGNTLTSAAIDFGERSTDTNPNDLLYGSFRYNSTIPFSPLVPEPSIFALAGLGAAAFLLIRRKH